MSGPKWHPSVDDDGRGCEWSPEGSRIAEKLVEDGMLREATVELPSWPTPVSVTGYELTELGRMTYCIGCEEP